MAEPVQDLGHGVFVIDTGFHRDQFDAAYLLVDHGRAAFIDTGTHLALPRLLAALDHVGLPKEAVDWVIPTHVHLDHAGGVGALMQALPTARCLVHPRGARHMIDPTALWAGATAVYGEQQMQSAYGTVLPVPASRVLTSVDNSQVQLGGRVLHVIHTPGHAKHHHCIWDPPSQGWFTGDTFGLSYPELNTAQGAWIMPTCTPVQFEPEALRQSIASLLARQPACMYLTHYGRVDEVPRLGQLLLSLLDDLVALGLTHRDDPNRHQALKDGQLALFSRSLRAQGCVLALHDMEELLAVDLELNAQGMTIWLQSLTQPGAAAPRSPDV